MHITELNKNIILLEADLKKLHDEYEIAKAELKYDIDVKISMEKLKDFVMKYINFDKKINTSTTRITEIEEKADNVIRYVSRKVAQLRNVTQISKDVLLPLENFLEEMKTNIEHHVHLQKKKYMIDAVARK